MRKKPTVIVAIPAFNEEKNILRLIKCINEQKQTKYILKTIWLYSDGSTDKTIELVRANYKDVKIYSFKKNLGKIKRMNQLMKLNTADILMPIDADITIKSPDVFNNLVEPFINDKKVGLVCSYHLANTPGSFVGKLAYFGFKVWDRARSKLGKRGTRYYCEGGLRAFSDSFAKSFKYPVDRTLSEDSFSFYFAVCNGYKVIVSKKARVYIDLPDSYQDYTKQMKRFLTASGIVKNNFDENVVAKFQTITPRIKLLAMAEEFVKDPLSGFFYIVLQSLVYLQMPFYNPKIVWTSITRK